MRIGVPREVKSNETRVALTAEAVKELTDAGHQVAIQVGAGASAGIPDADFAAVGAQLVPDAASAWGADLVLKVKEPQPSEFDLLSDSILFTFLHLAANEPLATALCKAGTTAISYDTVQTDDGALPILTPMSAIAGAVGALEGAHHLLSPYGGRGLLLAGAPGVPPARVVVIGAGVAGTAALERVIDAGADAVVMDIATDRLAALEERFGDAVTTVESTPQAVGEQVAQADVVIGAVLVPGRPAPVVVTHAMIESMKPGSVLVDIAIDQGGCVEDSRPTTHRDPVFEVSGSQLYCVANMPAAVGSTATQALVHASLPYVKGLADHGAAALDADPVLMRGLNADAGKIRNRAVHEAFPHLPADLA
ncbi:alanine dehydrogenase [Demequina flava]|uniref:alanine dehydrogenase n=1 Tax=Demequina flava TaxID=1095025 RepID=UPI0007847F80|nr:alanine dehydrogenase [Demequina flava]